MPKDNVLSAFDAFAFAKKTFVHRATLVYVYKTEQSIIWEKHCPLNISGCPRSLVILEIVEETKDTQD